MILPILFISGAEMAFLVFILVMVFGADKVPEIAKGLGKGIRGIKNATDEFKGEVLKSGHLNSTSKISKEVGNKVKDVKEEIDEITKRVKEN